MKKLISILMVLISFGAMAQDGHIIYNDHSNYKMYGRDVLVRTDATNLDTLTSVYNGSIAFDTAINHFVGYDKSEWNPIAYGRVRDTIIFLSSAEILALNGTPKTVVEAKGAGTLLQVLSATVKYTYVTTAYSSGTRLRIGTMPSQDPYSCVVLNATTNTIRTFEPPTHSIAGYAGSLENTSIKVDADVTPTTGDGTAQVWVRYQVIEF